MWGVGPECWGVSGAVLGLEAVEWIGCVPEMEAGGGRDVVDWMGGGGS